MVSFGKLVMAAGPCVLGAFGLYKYADSHSDLPTETQYATIDLNALYRNESWSKVIQCPSGVNESCLQSQLLTMLSDMKKNPSKSSPPSDGFSRNEFGNMMMNLGVTDEAVVNSYFETIERRGLSHYHDVATTICSSDFLFDTSSDQEGFITRSRMSRTLKGVVLSHMRTNSDEFAEKSDDMSDLLAESLTTDLFLSCGSQKINRQQFEEFLQDEDDTSSAVLRDLLNDFNTNACSVLL